MISTLKHHGKQEIRPEPYQRGVLNKVQKRFFLRLNPLLLRDCKMDLNETLGLYRVDPELMQGHRFNFRSEAQTGKIGISEKYYMGL